MPQNQINYTPTPTIKEFIKWYIPEELFYEYIVGPIGSSKTTGLFFKLIYMAQLQKPDINGMRRTKAVIVRNTLPQLKDTTIASWNRWFQEGIAGNWKLTENKFILRFNDVECEVLFRPLDTPEDVARVLSLEVTFAIIDEFVNIPRDIIEALSGRLGRYPANCTNLGMWGASNPDTEDNWWYDYLHKNLPNNARYFTQPSGASPDAENLINLPKGYYDNICKGKTTAWIRQFIHAEWGFSAAGTPVVNTFRNDLHIAQAPLKYNPELKLVIGVDPGLAGSALIFGQEDLHGRLLVLGELVQANYGAKRLIQERLKPYLRQYFPDIKSDQIIIAPDPAAANRAQTDERAVIDDFRKYFTVSYETNNRTAKRLDAIEHYTARLTDIGPALLIDAEKCPILTRALKGGWRYVFDQKKGMTKPEPEKNAYSHPGDAFGYLCRYYHKQSEKLDRYERYGVSSKKLIIPNKRFISNYHAR